MVDFTQELRHCCRNAKCRMKLKTPVENEHHAFCTPGCYSQFYFKHCIVCDENGFTCRLDYPFFGRMRIRGR